jgi:RNA polymerase sigma-70 factor (ECF subfamily)
MDEPSGLRTRASLMGRLRQQPTDQAAWKEFVDRYGPRIYDWCLKWHLQPTDAEDVTQNVLLNLARKMQSFAYDPSLRFRAWLRIVTHHALSDFLAGRKIGDVGGGGNQQLQCLAKQETSADLQQTLEAEFDHELLEEALARVQLRVSAQRWQAFRLTVLEGLPGAAVAKQLGMKVATVYTAKGKVQKMVQDEIRKLEGIDGA